MDLAKHFAKTTCDRYALPDKALSKQLAKILGTYSWPGNVRELGNAMEAAVIEAGRDPVIYPKHLPSHIRVSSLEKKKAKRLPPKSTSISGEDAPTLSYADYKSLRDRAYFQHLMDVCDHDITKASQLAGLSVPSIYRHLGLAGISTKNSQ
jgi:two-component system NtrC family response regulator